MKDRAGNYQDQLSRGGSGGEEACIKSFPGDPHYSPFSSPADLDTGELIVFGDGGEDVPLADALFASCALPVFYPPVQLLGRRLADGGLRGVVPLDVAARFPADRVIA
ncbi:MAG TPA: patatin-like phospholipase family protein, partial [Methanothrix sp.]|nr:patatin-like phospholipase family protein [Methanothrix sp.]